MNKEILYKSLNKYFSDLSKTQSLSDLNERNERENFYRSYTYEKIINMDEDEFYEYISKLWAMIIWGNKHYIIDKYISDNGFDHLKKSIANLLYGSEPIEQRWDNFKDNIKGLDLQ